MTVDVLVAELLRPHRTVVAARALDEAAIDHDDLLLVRTEKFRVILQGFPSRLLALPDGHVRDREEELHGTGDVILQVAVLVGHGVDDHHLLAGIEPPLEFGGGDDVIAAAHYFPGQLGSLFLGFDLLLELAVEEGQGRGG